MLKPIWLWLLGGVIVTGDDFQASSKIADDVMWPIGGCDNLRRNQNNVQQMAKEEEAQSGKLEQSYRRIAEVKPIRPEHAKENWKHQSCVKMVAIRPFAGDIFGKVGRVGLPENRVWFTQFVNS